MIMPRIGVLFLLVASYPPLLLPGSNGEVYHADWNGIKSRNQVFADDCRAEIVRDRKGNLVPKNSTFPSGIKALAGRLCP